VTIVLSFDNLKPEEEELFRAQVLSALVSLAPGSTMHVDGNGEVVVDAPAPCDLYCVHRASNNLLNVLLPGGAGSPQLTLKKSAAGYDRAADAVLWGDEDSSVSRLGHELVHALHDHLGVYQTGSRWWLDGEPVSQDTALAEGGTKEEDEELCTACAENSIRDELGLPPRKKYGGVDLDCDGDLKKYGDLCQPLDSSAKLPCTCDAKPIFVLEYIHWAYLRLRRLVEKLLSPHPAVPTAAGPDELDLFRPLILKSGPEAYAVLGLNELRRVARAELESGEFGLLPRDEPTHAVLLESVSPFGEYRVVMIEADDEWFRVHSNNRYVRDFTVFVGRRIPYRSFTAPADTVGTLAQDLSDLLGSDLPQGVSVREDFADGLTHFLTLQRGRDVTRAVISGYELAGFSSDPSEGLTGDTEIRLEAMTRCIGIWAEATERMSR
jgi:hypothetical protein